MTTKQLNQATAVVLFVTALVKLYKATEQK